MTIKRKKLVLSTAKSIHPPIEIEVDGKSYVNNPLSRTLFEEIKKYEKAALKGDIQALYKQVQLIFSVPMEILNKLDVRDVNSLLDYAMTRVFQDKAKTPEEETEKNESGPGADKSA